MQISNGASCKDNRGKEGASIAVPPAPTAPVPQLRAMSADLVEQCAERPEIDGQAVAAAMNDLGGWKSEAEGETKTGANEHTFECALGDPCVFPKNRTPHSGSAGEQRACNAPSCGPDRGTLACRRRCASAAWPSRPPCSDRNQPIECDQTHPTTRSERKKKNKKKIKKK